MTTHVLKCWPPFFDAVADGSKNFEIRLDDRGFQKGDILRLVRTHEDRPDEIEMNMVRNADGNYPPEADAAYDLHRRVTYVLYGPKFGLMAGYCIMALAPMESEQ